MTSSNLHRTSSKLLWNVFLAVCTSPFTFITHILRLFPPASLEQNFRAFLNAEPRLFFKKNKGCHSHQWVQPPPGVWELRELKKETKNACHLAATRLQPLLTASPGETEALKTQDASPRELRFISEEWFPWAQTFASSHRKMLNSLIWDIWFPITFCSYYLPFASKTPMYPDCPLSPGSSFLRITWDAPSWV